MNSGELSALTGCDDVPELTTSNIKSGDIILMEWVVLEVLVGILWLLLSTEELLLSSF